METIYGKRCWLQAVAGHSKIHVKSPGWKLRLRIHTKILNRGQRKMGMGIVQIRMSTLRSLFAEHFRNSILPTALVQAVLEQLDDNASPWIFIKTRGVFIKFKQLFVFWLDFPEISGNRRGGGLIRVTQHLRVQ